MTGDFPPSDISGFVNQACRAACDFAAVTGTETGAAAHRAGLPMSACPFAPSDPEGRAWRTDWIRAEAQSRHVAGTYGASAEDYQRAGLQPPERGTGRPFTSVIAAAADVLRQANDFARAMSDQLTMLTIPGVEVSEMADRLRGISSPSAAKDRARKRHRPCPRHGPTDATGGMCRPCSRGR